MEGGSAENVGNNFLSFTQDVIPLPAIHGLQGICPSMDIKNPVFRGEHRISFFVHYQPGW
jgi:hypothetical protein